MYDRNHYFGFGPMPKPKPKLVDTFGRYRNRDNLPSPVGIGLTDLPNISMQRTHWKRIFISVIGLFKPLASYRGSRVWYFRPFGQFRSGIPQKSAQPIASISVLQNNSEANLTFLGGHIPPCTPCVLTHFWKKRE